MSVQSFDEQNELILGEEGLQKLREKTFLIVGAGGLGSFVATELLRMGARKLIVVDNDRVEPSNLNRQILYSHGDLGKSKARVAAERLRSVFPDAKVEALSVRFDRAGGPYIVNRADVVIDCTDNFESKKLLNRICYIRGKPLVTGGVGKLEGWVSVFPFHLRDPQMPCLECLFPAEGKILRRFEGGPSLVTAVAAVATVQTNEAARLALGKPSPLAGKTLLIDLEGYSCAKIEISKDPNCPVCSR